MSGENGWFGLRINADDVCFEGLINGGEGKEREKREEEEEEREGDGREGISHGS